MPFEYMLRRFYDLEDGPVKDEMAWGLMPYTQPRLAALRVENESGDESMIDVYRRIGSLSEGEAEQLQADEEEGPTIEGEAEIVPLDRRRG